jgi:MFS family permease
VLKENPYRFTVLSLYVNYVLQGMAVIILSQNMGALVEQMNTTVSQFALVMSGIGLGRIISLHVAGWFSDKFGRKPSIIMGMVSYLFFFSGILMSTNVYVGITFAIFAGVANAFLDTGTYPVLLEAMPEIFESMSVLNRAFISVGQFLLPIVVGFTIVNELYFGITFLFCLVILAVNMVFVTKIVSFPKLNNDLSLKSEAMTDPSAVALPRHVKLIAGICLALFGFTSVSTFNIFVTWIPHVAEQLIGMGAATSVGLVSIYSLLSFVSVVLTSILVKKWIKPMYLVFIYTTLACVSLFFLGLVPSVLTAYVAVVGVGFFATGGIWQLGLSTLLELYPVNKGRITSYFSFLTSISVMTMPYMTGQLDLGDIMLFGAAITLGGAVLSFITIICIRGKMRSA